MQIKRVKLSGFKSFVEPTELRVEPGLTGVVGPNGCGKSNVLEAIRWVMGESSPKSMRGSGMEDVIFAGTASRPARDFAEVSLLVERDPAEVLSELGETEVEVTRRIERGAGSAYRLNGRDVRAKDVALLFADAATGAHSPALVSQGRISAVIAAKPVERRLLLEEAAGISGLHVRRKDAEQKLRAAEANLVRLDELIVDMEQRAGALRRQARAAEKYRSLTERIRVAEGRLIFARWREAAQAAADAKRELERAAEVVGAATRAQQAKAKAQAQAASELAAKRAATQAAREQATQLGHQLATLNAEQNALARRIADLADKRRSLASDLAREVALAEDAGEALTRLDAEIEALNGRIAAAEAGKGTIDSRTAQCEEEARQAEVDLAKARAQQAAEQAEERVARAALDAARAALDRVEAEKRRVEALMAELGDEAPLVERRRTARQERERAEAALSEAMAKLAAAEDRRREAAASRDAEQSHAAAARAGLAALQSEANALAQALDTGSGDRVLAHVKAAPGFERALAAALGDDLEASLDGDAPRRWTGSSRDKGDPALPLGTEPLLAHVEAPAALHRRLEQIAVVDSDDGTVRLAVGQRLVSRDGMLRRWDGYVAHGVGASAAERLIRQNRLADIEKALPRATAELDAAEASIQRALAAMQESQGAIESARAEEVQATAAIRQAVREEDVATTEIERLDVRKSSLVERLEQSETDLGEARERFHSAMQQADKLPDPSLLTQSVDALRRTAEGAQTALADVRAEAATHARAIGADRQRLQAASAEREDWRARAAKTTVRQADVRGRLQEAETASEDLADAPDLLAGKIRRLEAESAAAAAAADRASQDEREAEAALRREESDLATAGEALATAREARAGAQARHENQESRRIEMGRIAGERFECPPPLLPEKVGFDEETIADSADESTALERLVQERERLGPVNLVAESELAELEEARGGNQAEREELGLAINRLRGSIGSLNREGRARLLTAFEAVDRHFRSLFTTLFNGGQAHLELVESDDPLEAGLEIMAEPPGKRLSTLTLLSGGEQALTAVALIFALFLTNPAPICVLDEVDAPLDDANIERFCDLLDRMTQETDTRYLIVTHNAVTMSRMHRLFGVTMIEKGVSRLVSVDLGGAEQLLAAE